MQAPSHVAAGYFRNLYSHQEHYIMVSAVYCGIAFTMKRTMSMPWLYNRTASIYKFAFAHYQSKLQAILTYLDKSRQTWLWIDMVTEYSKTKLTYDSDRCIAIHRIASIIYREHLTNTRCRTSLGSIIGRDRLVEPFSYPQVI